MVFAAAEPDTDRTRIVANVDWLERPRSSPRREFWPGTWTYSDAAGQAGDNSNTQYALLGLNAASEAGVAVKPEVWAAVASATSSTTRIATAAGATRPGTSNRPPA